jgi:hypothetical protein
MEFTDREVVAKGNQIIDNVAKELNRKFKKYLVLQTYEDKIPDKIGGKQKHVLKYFLHKPWEVGNRVNVQGI